MSITLIFSTIWKKNIWVINSSAIQAQIFRTIQKSQNHFYKPIFNQGATHLEIAGIILLKFVEKLDNSIVVSIPKMICLLDCISWKNSQVLIKSVKLVVDLIIITLISTTQLITTWRYGLNLVLWLIKRAQLKKKWFLKRKKMQKIRLTPSFMIYQELQRNVKCSVL